MAATTTTANGHLTPPPGPVPAHTSPPDTAPPSNPQPNANAQKRKREDDSADPPGHHSQDTVPAAFEQNQRDWLVILQNHDLNPSFLKHQVQDDRTANTGEPSQKKARLSDAFARESIFAKLNSASYKSPAEFSEHAVHVSKDIAASLRRKEESVDGRTSSRLTVDDLKQIQRAKALADYITELVGRHTENHAVQPASHATSKQENRTENERPKPGNETPSSNTGTVLTLFGNAPTPKQLFSSMQKHTSKEDPVIKAELPVEEMSLPNGLTATKVMPVSTTDDKKSTTFEQAFPPPYNLPTLHPPKTYKRSSTRDNTVINWEFKDQVHRGSRKGGYTIQQMTGGDWLGYGGVDSVNEAASSAEKRKQRDRALSSGAESTKAQPERISSEEAMVREEEALFRRAYSSFAPSYDNAKALLPAETRSMIWWQKLGSKRFDQTLAIDPALSGESSVATSLTAQPFSAAETQDDDLARVVSDVEDIDDTTMDVKDAASKTGIDSILRKISELLETLASHQRIRNATLASSVSTTRTPISPAPILVSKLGKPDEPADDEISTYKSIQRELAYLVLKLPPYAVAKLDGDQLADLGISKMIQMEVKDVKGTMEEDQVARLAKYNAMATAAGISTLTRGASSSSGQHYSQTSQRTPAIGQAANTRYGQTGQLGTIRTPATQPPFQRSTSNHSQYATPSATASRPAYGQTSQYNRPSSTHQVYGQSNGQQYYQQRAQPTPGGYGTTYGQTYGQQTSQAQQQRPAYPSSQSLAQFQQRAAAYQANVGTPTAAQSSYNRTASPAKAPIGSVPPTQQHTQANMQQRPSYPYQQAGSGRATPNYPVTQPQTPINGYQQRPTPQPIVSRAASGTPQPPAPVAPLPQQSSTQTSNQHGQANGHS